MAERDIDLVLITGAGASRAFGNARNGGEAQLPLMADWSNALVQALATNSNNLKDLVGLDRDLDGPTFEERLGNFLALAQFWPMVSRAAKASINFPNVFQNMTEDVLEKWHLTVSNRIQDAVGIIHQSLLENFGFDRLDPEAALEPYLALLVGIGIRPDSRLVYATTNYDSLGEFVLEKLERRPETGVRRPFARRTERLDPEDIVETVGRCTPVLHLHGAAGWFQQTGFTPFANYESVLHARERIPLVMLPSLNKDYARDQIVDTIWREFHKALRRAKRVFVLGHSLNDRALVDALVTEVQPYERIAVSVIHDRSVTTTSLSRAFEQLPGAHRVQLTFDREFPDSDFSSADWIHSAASAEN